jgi:hypothetical protein
MSSYLLLAAISSNFFLLLTSFLKVSQLALVVLSWYHCRFSPDGTCDSQQFLFNIYFNSAFLFFFIPRTSRPENETSHTPFQNQLRVIVYKKDVCRLFRHVFDSA